MAYSVSVRVAMLSATRIMRLMIKRLKIGSLMRFGLFFMFDFSPGSSPSGITMAVSVTKLIQRICTGTIGSGIPMASAPIIVSTSPALVDRR
ncbi:hypothetical protein D3C85_1253220 [compost metagenome]